MIYRVKDLENNEIINIKAADYEAMCLIANKLLDQWACIGWSAEPKGE